MRLRLGKHGGKHAWGNAGVAPETLEERGWVRKQFLGVIQGREIDRWINKMQGSSRLETGNWHSGIEIGRKRREGFRKKYMEEEGK